MIRQNSWRRQEQQGKKAQCSYYLKKMNSLNQSELYPSTKKLLSGRINEREDTALRYRTEKKGENRMKETKKKLLQETTAILKKLDRESLAIIRSNAEILRARDTLEEQKAG